MHEHRYRIFLILLGSTSSCSLVRTCFLVKPTINSLSLSWFVLLTKSTSTTVLPAGGKDGQIHFHSVRESKNAVLDTASECVLQNFASLASVLIHKHFSRFYVTKLCKLSQFPFSLGRVVKLEKTSTAISSTSNPLAASSCFAALWAALWIKWQGHPRCRELDSRLPV